MAAAVCAMSHGAEAQSRLGPERRDINDFAGDIWSVWTSPVHPDRRAALPMLGAASAIAGVGVFADSAVYAWMTTHPNAFVVRELSPLRERKGVPFYELGSGQVLLPLSGVLYAAGRLSHDASLRDAGLGCAAGHLSSASLREVIYLLVARARPRVTADADDIRIPGSFNWNWHSFLSGHAANSMACASFFAHRFSLGIAEPAMYAYVGAIGLGRMADGRHWASDVVAGSMMGFAIGKALADRQDHRNAARAATIAGSSSQRTPILSWSFSF